MEHDGILDIDNALHIGALHRIYLPIIQLALDKYRTRVHHHKKQGALGMCEKREGHEKKERA
jgi:hypothetical protein